MATPSPAPSALPSGNYGAAGSFGAKEPGFDGVQAKRKPSGLLMCAAFVVPGLVFVLFLSLESFNAHFSNPSIGSTCLFLGLLLVVVLAVPAVQQLRSVGRSAVVFWQVLLVVATAFAVALSITLGASNYEQNMRPYYDITNLNEYPTVDPALYTGNQMMDAGQIHFAEGTRLETKYSMAFRNDDVYCVVPIVSDTEGESYDFWAVGLNCCTGDSNSFHCGEYANPSARSGLRLMHDEQRAYFRLAVQQAEAAFDIEANHALFFYWMQDTQAEIDAYESHGYQFFLVAVLGFLAFNLLIVVSAAVLTAKM